MACKQENSFAVGKTGIKVNEVGPLETGGDKWAWDYVPVPTDLCNLCQNRVKQGKKPACVTHCTIGVMKYAPVSELVEFMEVTPKTVIFAPR